MGDPYGFDCRKARQEERIQRREEQASLARRQFDRGPSVPAGLRGKASEEEIQRWTTHLPAKPPGVR